MDTGKVKNKQTKRKLLVRPHESAANNGISWTIILLVLVMVGFAIGVLWVILSRKKTIPSEKTLPRGWYWMGSACNSAIDKYGTAVLETEAIKDASGNATGVILRLKVTNNISLQAAKHSDMSMPEFDLELLSGLLTEAVKSLLEQNPTISSSTGITGATESPDENNAVQWQLYRRYARFVLKPTTSYKWQNKNGALYSPPIIVFRLENIGAWYRGLQ